MIVNVTTIFAQSSGAGKSAVKLFRISGINAFDALKMLGITTTVAHATSIVRKIYTKDKYLIDKAVITCFFAPKSFTGENVVEICTHGSLAISEMLTSALLECKNFELAQPGEFTKRAFLNGKINLTQAEAVADLIDSQTKLQHRQSIMHMQGALSDVCKQLQGYAIEIMSLLEASIDFPEEDMPKQSLDKVQYLACMMRNALHKHVSDASKGIRLHEGISIGIFGSPNTGKSSLMNILSKKNISIVTEKKGTTTDLIESHIDIAGYPIKIIDTAGIHHFAQDQVEKIGIQKATSLIDKCDMKLFVLDASAQDNSIDQFRPYLSDQDIVIVNKMDLLNFIPKKIHHLKNLQVCYVSCKSSYGIKDLVDVIVNKCNNLMPVAGSCTLTKSRHKKHLQDALMHLDNFQSTTDVLLKSEEMRLAINNISCLTGDNLQEDILDSIFSKFCIGK